MPKFDFENTDGIPELFTKEHYDAWIDYIAEKECDTVVDELYPDLEQAEIGHDQVGSAVENSGRVFFGNAELVDAYHDVLEYSDSLYHGGETVDPTEDDLLGKAAEVTRDLIIQDVTTATMAKLENAADQ